MMARTQAQFNQALEDAIRRSGMTNRNYWIVPTFIGYYAAMEKPEAHTLPAGTEAVEVNAAGKTLGSIKSVRQVKRGFPE